MSRNRQNNLRPFLNYAVTILSISSSFILMAPIVYDLIVYRAPTDVGVYLFMWGSLILGVGIFLRYFTYTTAPLTLTSALYITLLNWLVVPILIAIPVARILAIPFIDAWFEAVSGLTTTGLSVFSGSYDNGVYVPSVEELPPEILLWRSLSQWVGGLGIVVFMIVVIARTPGIVVLYRSEGRFERLEPSLSKTVREMLAIYTLLTFIETLVLRYGGMSWFDAVNHAMTALSTGGFSTKNSSIAAFASRLLEIATIFGMWLGATNFLDHKNMLKARIQELVRSVELKTFLYLLAIMTGFSAYILHAGSSLDTAEVWNRFYQVFSALTTTGFQTIDIHAEDPAFKMVLIVAMLIGGSVFSTAGGVKLLRIAIVAKSLKNMIASFITPKGYVASSRLGRYTVTPSVAVEALGLIFIYAVTVIVSTLIMVPFVSPEYSFMDAFFEAASGLATTGLSTGISSASAHTVVKLVLMANMILGRLEIVPFIVGIYSLACRR